MYNNYNNHFQTHDTRARYQDRLWFLEQQRLSQQLGDMSNAAFAAAVRPNMTGQMTGSVGYDLNGNIYYYSRPDTVPSNMTAPTMGYGMPAQSSHYGTPLQQGTPVMTAQLQAYVPPVQYQHGTHGMPAQPQPQPQPHSQHGPHGQYQHGTHGLPAQSHSQIGPPPVQYQHGPHIVPAQSHLQYAPPPVHQQHGPHVVPAQSHLQYAPPPVQQQPAAFGTNAALAASVRSSAVRPNMTGQTTVNRAGIENVHPNVVAGPGVPIAQSDNNDDDDDSDSYNFRARDGKRRYRESLQRYVDRVGPYRKVGRRSWEKDEVGSYRVRWEKKVA